MYIDKYLIFKNDSVYFIITIFGAHVNKIIQDCHRSVHVYIKGLQHYLIVNCDGLLKMDTFKLKPESSYV